MAKIRCLYKQERRRPVFIEIDNTLRSFQDIVRGYIEVVNLTNDLAIVCNEEGLINGMLYNYTLCGHEFHGPIIICGVKGEEFTDCPEEAKKLLFGGKK